MTGLAMLGRPVTAIMAEFDAEEREERRRWFSTGRNDPCPCGSGKKYKACCLDKTRRRP